MAKIKLTYFNAKGRAETIRLILAQAGVEYEDYRIARDQWPTVKKETPMGQVPILEYDGDVFCQSTTIARFLARKYNLAGKNDIAAAEADQAVDALNDIFSHFVAWRKESDETKKNEMMKVLTEETIPAWLQMMEKYLTSKGGKYLAGDELTWADLAFFNFASMILMDKMPQVKLSEYKNIDGLVQKVGDLPKIKKWINDRPVTEI